MRKSLYRWVAAMMIGAASMAHAAEEPAPAASSLSFSGGVDWVSAYFMRGYLQEEHGLIVQPYGQLNLKTFSSERVSVTPFVGTWNSLHDEHTGASESGPDAWYEADVYVGADFAFGDFTLTPVFTAYMYPNDAYDTILEAGLKLAYNDASLMSKAGVPIAFKPYVAGYWEVDDQNPGATNDGYLEAGIAPGFEYTVGKVPVTLCFPATVGMSLDDYYFNDHGGNEFIGYGSIGIAACVPLPIPAKWGSWALTGSVSYLHLFADSVQQANGGNENAVVWKAGISFSY